MLVDHNCTICNHITITIQKLLYSSVLGFLLVLKLYRLKMKNVCIVVNSQFTVFDDSIHYFGI